MNSTKYPLVDHTNPILKQTLDLFDFSNPPIDPIEFAHELAQHLLIYGGIGLAANQLGLPYRVFAIKSNPVIVAYNPRIVDASSKEVVLDEACLSYPGLALKVSRPETIKVRYTYPNGATETLIYSGMTARIFQHELDHLNGIMFTERVGPVALALAKSKLRKKVKI